MRLFGTIILFFSGTSWILSGFMWYPLFGRPIIELPQRWQVNSLCGITLKKQLITRRNARSVEN